MDQKCISFVCNADCYFRLAAAIERHTLKGYMLIKCHPSQRNSKQNAAAE